MQMHWMLYPFKCQPHKMVKHTQNCKLPTNCLSVFDHFVGFAVKGYRSFEKHLHQEIISTNLAITIKRQSKYN